MLTLAFLSAHSYTTRGSFSIPIKANPKSHDTSRLLECRFYYAFYNRNGFQNGGLQTQGIKFGHFFPDFYFMKFLALLPRPLEYVRFRCGGWINRRSFCRQRGAFSLNQSIIFSPFPRPASRKA